MRQPVLGMLLLLQVHCHDNLTAQLEEPAGPLQITRLTLSDARSRGAPVFTDTSLPDCSRPENQEDRVCKNDVFMDRYAPHKSPPTPDAELRVVFNKPPLLLSGRPIEVKDGLFSQQDASVVDLSCQGCTGVPARQRGLDVTGSGVSFDPTLIPYGPALRLRVDSAADAKAALEPDTTYQVQISAQLSGRDGQGITIDERAQALLRFKTEPFKVLQVGIGDEGVDAYVHASTEAGAGTAEQPYRVERRLALDGALALKVNAPLDDAVLTAARGTAQVEGRVVPVKLGYARKIMDRCELGGHRRVFIYPEVGDWGVAADRDKVITVNLPAGALRDVSQAPGHPTGQGRHVLPEVVLRATLSGEPAPTDYQGLRLAQVRGLAGCP